MTRMPGTPAPADVMAFGRGAPTSSPIAESPQEQAQRSSAITRQVFPPWLYSLPSGNDFFGFNVFSTPDVQAGAVAKSAILPAGNGRSIFSEAFKLPDMTEGVCRVVSIYIQQPTPLLNVDFVTRINQGPVQGWTFASFPRTANNLSISFPGILRLPQGSTLDVQIINRDGNGPWTVGVQFSGWYWNIAEAKRLYGNIY